MSTPTPDGRWSDALAGPDDARKVSQPTVARSNGDRPTSKRGRSLRIVTAHHTIVTVDIAGFGLRERTNLNQVRVRKGMYDALKRAFNRAGIRWASCWHEDRGDGVLILADANVPKARFVDRLPETLAEALTTHNRTHPVEERIRLRLALHAGEVNYDEHGVTSVAVTHTFRLLDANSAKNALAKSSAVLAVVASKWFFDEVVRHSEASHLRTYRRTEVEHKETSTVAWIRLLRARNVKQVRATHPVRPRRT